MSSNFIDEYLVRLGASVDATGVNKFNAALHEMSGNFEHSVQGISKHILSVEGLLVSGFAAIGVAALGVADKVAMADQEFRLFALHMYIGKEQARSLKVAMDALGQPLENLAWDPELQGRAKQLIQDQRVMAPGGDFNAQMRKIRDIRFEFTRMEVELQYLGMHVVQDFMQALGVGPDQLLNRLRQFNNWVTYSLPEISKKVVQYFLPIWRDIERIMKDVWQVAVDFAQVFTNIVSLLSGDPAIGGALSFDKLAKSIEKVTHWIAVATDFVLKFVGLLSGAIVGGTVGGVLGALIGGIAGIPAGPPGIIAGAALGGGLGSTVGGVGGGLLGGLFDMWRAAQPASTALGSGTLPDFSTPAGMQRLLAALVAQESGGNPNAVSSKGAIGLTQLMPGTAQALGVNPYNPAQNLQGGEDYIRQLAEHYHGNVAEALGAYNAGPGRMDAFLAGKATLPAETRDYIGRVLGRAGATGTVNVGGVVVNIVQPGASAGEIATRVADETGKRVQRNLDEFQQQAWSY
jgi:Transglycosylase SLT domain